MEFEKETLSIIFSENTFISFIFQWKQLKGNWNWYNFNLIEISFMKDIIVPGIEVTFILFGIGFSFRHNFDWGGSEIKEIIDDLEEENIKKLN